MRGKREMLAFARKNGRITPAHAGKTYLGYLGRIRATDHPRACGENLLADADTQANLGSPPRMRGKHRVFGEGTADMRITPAHAGKTLAVLRAQTPLTDHPRACGENRFFTRKATLWGGSPPRMRGKPVLCKENLCSDRITPAHAGKTFGITKITGLESDHPRACGENASNAINSAVGFGSPPRMRGKPSHLLFSSRSRRITPAHAGKTGGSVRSCLSISDHPRACGENFFIKRLTFFPGGSPPRMRGKQGIYEFEANVNRITPAHAGKTNLDS